MDCFPNGKYPISTIFRIIEFVSKTTRVCKVTWPLIAMTKVLISDDT